MLVADTLPRGQDRASINTAISKDLVYCSLYV